MILGLSMAGRILHLSMAFCGSVCAITGAVSVGNAAPPKAPPDKETLQTVSSVDLVRYMGTWYEIARTPNRYENKCKGDVIVHYELNQEGRINLKNQCRLQDGNTDTAQAHGSVVDTVSKSKLRVTFLWPFYADYWIIDLDKDYRFAVVGEPDRRYLWIISREPQIDPQTYQQILKHISEHGYDLSRIIMTPQSQASANLQTGTASKK